MCMNSFDGYFTAFFVAITTFIAAIAFYALIIHPRDQVGFEIMQCMGDDRSREAYESCRVQVLERRAR